jgi:hypothetical protein
VVFSDLRRRPHGARVGLNYDYEVNYRDLRKHFVGTDNRVLLPAIPYSPTENCYPGETSAPARQILQRDTTWAPTRSTAIF